MPVKCLYEIDEIGILLSGSWDRSVFVWNLEVRILLSFLMVLGV